MLVTVVCFGVLRDFLPDDAAAGRAEIELSAGATVGSALDALGAPRSLAFALLVDGEPAELGSELSEGCEVTLMPPFSGGSPIKELAHGTGRKS